MPGRAVQCLLPLDPVADLQMRYLPYGELARNREAMGRFGTGLEAVEAIARTLM